MGLGALFVSDDRRVAMITSQHTEVKQNRIGNMIAIAFLVAAVILGGIALARPGLLASSSAEPVSAPQKSDFVEGSFLCSGEFSAMTNNQIAEFSGTWRGEREAEIKIVEFINGQPSDKINGKLFAGVDDLLYTGNTVYVSDVGQRQSVVLRAEGIRPDHEFGVYARWWIDGGYVLLAKWRGDEQNKCGDPAGSFGPQGR